MAKEPSEKNRWKSIFNPESYVHDAQYITELVCWKKAKSEGKDLSYKFWDNPEWKTYYRNQITAANTLLKKYPAKAIVKALNNPEIKWLYSLRAPQLIKYITPEVKKIEAEAKLEHNRELTDILTKPADKPIQSNALSKLRGLDG